MKPLAKIARKLAATQSLFTVRQTPEADVRSFLAQLAPVETDCPLIRMGGENDGGYLIPDDLDGIEACFSPGVDQTATFEAALLERGIPSVLADYSVAAPPAALAQCVFDRRYLAAHDDEINITLANWLRWRGGETKQDLLLQMDIEGSEYPVLIESSPATLSRFRIIAIEFHHFEQLFNPIMFALIRESFAKLLQDFAVVHIHPNNYQGLFRVGNTWVPGMPEFTFWRKDRIRSTKPATQFPHPLDRPNIPAKPDVVLPESMIGR